MRREPNKGIAIALLIGGLIGAFLARHPLTPPHNALASDRFVPVETVKVVKIVPPVVDYDPGEAEEVAKKCVKGCVCSRTGKCICKNCPNKLEATKAKATARAEYLYAREEAIDQQIPLVIGVGVDAPNGEWIAVRYDGFDTGSQSDGLVVAVPKGKELKWHEVISPTSTPEEIQAEAKLRSKLIVLASQPVQTQSFGNCANGQCGTMNQPQMQSGGMFGGGNCSGGSCGASSGRFGRRR